MAETIPSSFESDTEDDSDKKKGRKQKSSGTPIAVPLPVERASSAPAPEASKPVKADFQEAPRAFLDKLIGKPAETDEARQPEKSSDSERSEVIMESPVAPAVEASPQSTQYETAAEAEHNVAQDLADGAEISLQEIRQVPPARDEHIVAEALDIAAQAEQSAAGVGPENAEQALSADAQIAPGAEQGAEADRALPEDLEAVPDDYSVQTPGIPATYMQTPRSTLNPFRARPFTGRNRPATPPTPPSAGFYGVPMPGAVPPSGSGGNVLPNPSYNVAAPNYNAAPTAQNPNVQRALDDAEAEGRQRGRREGVLTGLLVGGGIEHFRHKRREKKLAKQYEKEMKVQQERVERLESDYAVAREERSAERTRAEAKLTSLQQAQEIERKDREKVAAEAKRIADKEQAQIEEGLAIPKDHHVERSAWHNIEVDKSGKAVQESAFEYGHEYYKERAHEMTPSQQQLDAAAGEVALVAAALSDTQQPQPQAQKQNTQAVPSNTSDLDIQYTSAPRRIVRAVTTPPSSPLATLIWLGALIFIVILLLVLAA